MNSFFNTILSPYTVDDFFDKFHEKDILHIQRKDDRYYNDILTSKEISGYLERQDVFYPSLRIVKNGKEIPNGEYTLKSTPIGHHRKDGIINTDKAFALFNDGATFVIQAGQRYFDNLSRCCLELSQKFQSPVQANLYLTPNKSQGFNPHWDTHDVFVLQISGTKTWHLYGFEKELPTKNQTFVSKGYSKEPIQTIQLAPGDFLYVPRGYVHDAVADDGISSHITIGVLSFTWARFFNELFPQLETFKTFREAVPFWKENLSDILKQKMEALKEKISELDTDKGFERLTKSFKSAQPQPFHGYFESLLNIDKVADNTPLALNESVIFNFAEKEAAYELQLHGKMIQFSEALKPAVDYIFRNKKFVLSDLPGHSDATKELALNFIREGVVYIDEL
ncbi:cupin domain-containing protein [Niabella insulamsoli]|uniref:cupin domain-containing protein n=1 Tax=Niabella insulamsoli TaxID=3144874 RepID=UPI0031FC23EF